MSATTPGIRRIWMEAIVQCVEQRMARVSRGSGAMDRASSVADAAAVKSDLADQNASNSSQAVSDKAEPELTPVPVPQLLSTDAYAPPATCSDNVLHADSNSTDVCGIFTQSLYLLLFS